VATFTFSDNVGITGYGVNQSNTEEPTYVETNNTSVTWTASNAGTYYVWVKDTVENKSNEAFTIVSTAFCAYNVGQTWNYGYTGGVQSFSVPCTGTYQLEVWGASGQPNGGGAGLGGYSKGTKQLSTDTAIYTVVGGTSSSSAGGYNGGGVGGGNGKGGGGATHMAVTNRGVLSNYSSYRGEILLVAGGGGSGNYGYGTSGTGGSGGGMTGGSTIYSDDDSNPPMNTGGTQVSGGTCTNYRYTGAGFGYGAQTGGNSAGGGGGGWYGGTSGDGYWGAGSGGSGYIGGVSNGSMQNGVRSGNGYARITLTSLSN